VAGPPRGQNGPMQFDATIPVLRIFSADQAKDFYLGYLGFQLDWERRDSAQLYAQISRAGLVLHLSEHAGDAGPGAAVFIAMRDLAAWQAELASKPYRSAAPGLSDGLQGAELVLTDPFGNRLRFGEAAGGAARSAATAPPQNAPLTRAQVRAEYLKARAEGSLPRDGEVG